MTKKDKKEIVIMIEEVLDRKLDEKLDKKLDCHGIGH